MNSEGTTIRTSRRIGSSRSRDRFASRRRHAAAQFLFAVRRQPQDMPSPDDVAKVDRQAAEDLVALRDAPIAPDYTGPVLFDAPAAGSLLAQALSPSLSGARPPLSMLPAFDEMMERMGGRSEWSGRVGTRVLPANVSLVDDPTMKDFSSAAADRRLRDRRRGRKRPARRDRENGILKDELMSRRPGPDFEASNGHARSAAAFRHSSAAEQSDFLGRPAASTLQT